VAGEILVARRLRPAAIMHLQTWTRLVVLPLACACSPASPGAPSRVDAGPATPPPPPMGTDAGRDTPPPPPPPPPSDSCTTSAGMDVDGDGFPNGADCNDCSPQVNPGAFDLRANGIDEDCDGADATASDCDAALAMAGSATDAARALGICQDAVGDSWGLVSARFTVADGTGAPRSDQTGVLPSFGTNAPRAGGAVFALSTGAARAPGQTGFTSECDEYDAAWDDPFSPPPTPMGDAPGFPTSSPSCPGVRSGDTYNAAALEVQIKVPTNARGFSFSSSFFTYEYPLYICSEFNDFFVALRQTPSGWENILFDTAGNPVSVNNGLLQACDAGTHGGKRFDCALGRAPLAGTGFDIDTACGEDASESETDDFFPELITADQVGAGTGWLRTVAPVTPGEILTIRFAIWDSGDGTLDSLAILDAFEWELEEITETETEPELI